MISFSEKGLSEEAKKMLLKNKEKSKFIRNAIEFYIQNKNLSFEVNKENEKVILSELKEIKEILLRNREGEKIEEKIEKITEEKPQGNITSNIIEETIKKHTSEDEEFIKNSLIF